MIALQASWVWAVWLAAAGTHDESSGRARLVELDVYPVEVALESGADRQSLVVRATSADGLTWDVTDRVSWSPEGDEAARLDEGRLVPIRDGAMTWTASLDGLEAQTTVTVTGAAETPPISFRTDVMPVFLRAGCNSGACHGSARGQDGFRLSLFGFDPDGDHFRLTRELSTRRLNLAVPTESLLLEKSLGTVAHTGGRRFDEASEEYRRLLRWMEAGAPTDDGEVVVPVSLEVLPQGLVLEGGGTRQRLTVRAHYADGTDRDVTDMALFLSNNAATADADESGVVTSGARGEAFVMARYHTFTVGTQVIVVPPHATEPEWDFTPANHIDSLVAEKWRKLRIAPSARCSDEEFLRRVTLDVVGQLPTSAERASFLADDASDKRARWVDGLLERKEFTELWVMRFAEMLQIRSQVNRGVSYKATLLYHHWLQSRIAANVPIDDIVRELLSSTGGTFSTPATNFYQVERDAMKLAENTAQAFMGMRIQCAQCHNHPFDRWTMDDYYGWVSFFTQVGRKPAEDPRETVIYNRGRGEQNHPVTGSAVPPTFLGGARPDPKGRDRRAVLADWIVSEENPHFARNLANLVWHHFFGVGIVEPVDDVRVSNPPSNPVLLDELADRFVAYDFDFQRFVRDLCNSEVYQLSTVPNDTNRSDDRNFSHGTVRRLRAEVLLDVLSQVTETPNKFQGLPEGARAVQIADGNVTNYFLRTFGRATRESVCACEVVMDPSLSQALHLLNGGTTVRRIANGGAVTKCVDAGLSNAEVVDELFVRCLTRSPTESERARLLADVPAEPREARIAALEDIFWALLNSKELLFNH